MPDETPDRPTEPATPPQGPWWSRPADGAAGEPAGSQPPYGAYGEPAAPDAPPTAFGAPDQGPSWSYPTDTLGGDPRQQQDRDRRKSRLAVGGAVLATALLAGGAGGLVGAKLGNDDRGTLTDASASLGSTSPTANVDRAPDSVAGVAARVLKSVVSINVTDGSGSGGSGSGVVLRSDGYVLTNNHVVAAGASSGTITVSFNGAEGTEVPASIVGRDPETDLAVLKVKTDKQLVPAAIGQSRGLVVGDPVIAVGSPLGLAGTVTTGIVSALNRTVNVPAEDGGRATPLFNAIQTDAAINPGNSGGALVDGRGQLVGINSAIATLGSGGGGPFGGSSQSGSIGVGFAIPVDEAKSVAEELIRTGRATHPAIGVEAGTVSEGAGGRPGARVSRVVADGPAQKAGLQPGDLIVALGDTKVGSVDELILAIREHRVGDKVTVTYMRGGATKTAEVVLQDKNAD
jgi:putative serine protease PepD